MLRSIGAELVADDAGELAAGLGRLASLNCQVCAPYYAQLVAAAASEVGLLSGLEKFMAQFDDCGMIQGLQCCSFCAESGSGCQSPAAESYQ